MPLTQYRAKRDFNRTVEPTGSAVHDRGAPSVFVVQKHAARHLHYDFRLELDGTLKSWAVPKGIPLKKGEKRLALQVEDHPLEYGGFEGTIAPGNYGAGTVMVWDAGFYESVGLDPRAAIKRGRITIRLTGKKLNGEWALIRMPTSGKDKSHPWLLIKTTKDAGRVSQKRMDESVLTGRTVQQIANASGTTNGTRGKSHEKARVPRRSGKLAV
jgi:bifunctional non-homologous end joining protein LigD